MMFKKSLISIAVASVLTGCGGGSNGVNGVNGANGADGADGSASISKTNTVCIDANANAVCETSETSETSVAWAAGTTAISTALTSADHPLAYNDVNGYTLTAPAGSASLDLDSTFLANELIFNQVIANKTVADVNAYLTDKLGTLTDQNKADIAMAIKNAVVRYDYTHPAKRNLIIAAVISKVVEGGSAGLADAASVFVTEEDIKNANVQTLTKLNLSLLVEDNVDDEIAATKTAGWVDAAHASIRTVHANGGKILGGSRWHNSLVIMDAAEGSTATFNSVSVVSDDGDHVDSATGVSEDRLRGAVLNSDASVVYFNVPNYSDNPHEGTNGFFRAVVGAGNTIATVSDLDDNGITKVITLDEAVAGNVRLKQKITSFAVAPDDSKVVLFDDDDNLIVYDGTLTSTPVVMAMPDVESLAVSADKVYVSKGDNKIYMYSAADLSEKGSVEFGFEPDEFSVSGDGTKIVAFTHGHDHSGVKTIAIYDKTTGKIDQSSIKFKSDTAAISPDFTKLAIVGHEESNMAIVNLTIPGFSIQSTYEVSSRSVSWVDNENVSVINGRNSLAVINIEETVENVNLETKVAFGKAGLGPASINGGGFMNAIIQDVKLLTNYENIGINWSSTNSALVVGMGDDLGKGIVTRPDATGTSATGKLTANLSADFRGDVFADSVAFDTTVRKAPAALGDAKFVDAGNIGSQYMAVNSDGSVVAVSTRYKNAADKNVYGFNTFKLDAGGTPVAVTGTADAPKVYTATESLVGVGVSGGFVIGVTKDEDDATKARIFTVAVDSNGDMAGTVTSEVDISGGNPISRGGVGFSEDKSTIAVMVFNETTEQYTAEIFTVNASGTLSAGAPIPMEPTASYKTYGPPVVTNDGMVVYQRTEDSVIKSTAGATKDAEIPVNEVARVFSNNNLIFVNTYEGNVYTYDMDLSEGSEKTFSTGTGGRMYAGDATATHYYIPVQRTSSELNGVYQLSIGTDGTLTEKAFTNIPERPDRLAVRGGSVYFSNRVDKSYKMGVIQP